jgi:hypothetical protein
MQIIIWNESTAFKRLTLPLGCQLRAIVRTMARPKAQVLTLGASVFLRMFVQIVLDQAHTTDSAVRRISH